MDPREVIEWIGCVMAFITIIFMILGLGSYLMRFLYEHTLHSETEPSTTEQRPIPRVPSISSNLRRVRSRHEFSRFV